MRLKSSLVLLSAIFYWVSILTSPVLAGQEQPKKSSINELLHSYLELTSARHQVLSENVANLNTPGYKANEVEMPANINKLAGKQAGIHRSVFLRLTSSKHMIGRKVANSKFRVKQAEDSFEVKPNQNNVSLFQQMSKISQNQSEYNKALTAYQGINSLVPTILGIGK